MCIRDREWSAVKGAAGYEQQINYKRDGKWSGWKNYIYFKNDEAYGTGRFYFNNYETELKEAKAELKRNAKIPSKKGYLWVLDKNLNNKDVYKRQTQDEAPQTARSGT